MGEKAEASINEGSPIDPSGTHAVLPLTSEVYHQGAWVTLPAGEIKIDYQINVISKTSGSSIPYLDIPFELTMRSAEGNEIEIRRPLSDSATCKGFGDVYTRTLYGKADLPDEGHYHVQAAGQKHLSGEPHLRFT